MTKKKGYWYIFNSMYVITVSVGNLAFLDKFSPLIQQNILLMIIYQLILFYALILIFSLMLFKIRYSPFGPLKRQPFPEEKIIEEFVARGKIGIIPLATPFSLVRWTLFENGLGITINKVLKIFIPYKNIKTIDHTKLIHNSREIYNPIVTEERILNKLKENLQ